MKKEKITSEHNSDLMVKPSRAAFKMDRKGKVHSNLDHLETAAYRGRKHELTLIDAEQEIKDWLK